jgi:cytochrome c oxidase assembly factor CtaG
VFGVQDMLAGWAIDPIPTAGIGLAAIGYASALHAVRRAGRLWPIRRNVAVGAGLLVLVIALDGPPDTFADTSFAVHMVQHLLIQQVAAPLLLIGAPITLILRADPSWLRRRILVRILRSRAIYLLSRPPVAFMLFGAALVGSHLTGFYELALRNENVHACEHVVYLATALLFWYPAVGVDPGPARPEHAARLFYLLLIMPVMAFLGLAIASTGRILYSYYAAHAPPWGATPLQDQHLAGTMMWVSGMITIPPLAVVVLMRWLDQDEKKITRREAVAADAAARG